MKITVIGSGHVGLVTGACFAELGHDVICVDHDKKKLQTLKDGKIPFYEPGLDKLVHANYIEGRLSFSGDTISAVLASEIIFICVGTPSRKTGEVDMSAIKKTASQIAQALNGYKLVVEKSTVPVETGEWILKTLKKQAPKGVEFDVASNPEFLREGAAIHDFMHPDRVIIGVSSQKAASYLVQLYSPLNAPILMTDIKSAELIKHASNSFLAMKISFANMLANLCEKTGADVVKVAKGIGLDKRIGEDFLKAGIGYGGSCFPKDVSAFIHIGKKSGCNFKLIEEVRNINEERRMHFIKRLEKVIGKFKGKTIAIWGLSFKPETDDTREAPATYIIKELIKRKVKNIRAFDPKTMDNMKKIFPNIIYSKCPYEAIKGADALLILTEWKDFSHPDLLKIKASLKKPIIADGRNIYDPQKMKRMGFSYIPIGRL
ncbi:MAG: UDP-glucose/GDP-mannose dehydrogenase family protein [Candidatus Omnitrophica bacterium]|nr:UDP-glucose/GDP-mannose dehydrogenase family protein [Candidatus Omnitrophota bacterium]MBU1047487.1 UDP-glucose/GDP-mannose dehydrogenase family protein [Candidatus Omnitrophota bacterium]MBU1631367.1 UDP-glucose/GDP-mannose dehydrogenase family protein [Candidatus Omnitrophota bacterium]MBU1767745.1 UDP-glucose/GDP-mannose dehydrogenase family protein [Candidatus Omnitrophota bacterium]MBU1888850.1 UDP-glucose/GDP-mannose dehydrogenase family protein [Candidatus Omnitrophota bacterium]